MYPAAGIPIWIVLGGIIGWLSGKVTHTDGYRGTMANTGVGAVSAVLAGFVVTFFYHGERSTSGFGLAIIVAALAAIAAVAVYRFVFPLRSPTLR
jgi:uncharacterized membrane protein YeaQ/YmgE (transglycosylase-associated protein family)